MTEFIERSDPMKAKKVGADDYCLKSPDCIKLIEAIKNLFVA